MQFPMNVASTRFADSENESQLQICDILAGATSAFVRNRLQQGGDQTFFDRLADAGIVSLIGGGLWPGTEVTPEELEMEGSDHNMSIKWMSHQVAAMKNR